MTFLVETEKYELQKSNKKVDYDNAATKWYKRPKILSEMRLTYAIIESS